MNTVEADRKTVVKVNELESLVGVELGPTAWVTISQDDITSFAKITGDHQWIHTDPTRAAATPQGTTIAHGYLVLSLVAAVSQQLLDIDGAPSRINYGLNRVRFPSAVPSGTKVRGRMTLASVNHGPAGIQLGYTISLEGDGVRKPVCVAETLSFIPFESALEKEAPRGQAE